MSASARRSMTIETAVARDARRNGGPQPGKVALRAGAAAVGGGAAAAKLSVFVAADNRLLREALAHMLMKKGNIEIVGLESDGHLQAEGLAQTGAHVLLLTSRGTLNDDLMMIQRVRETTPGIRILLLGMAKNEAEFLQCVRAGISGYLLHDASSEEVVAGVRAVHAGDAVCPGSLCTSLFRYFESEAASLLPVSARRSLGLTRREQQLIPLIGKGLTNKEIANHFSLSEQTVKNHLYRMKQKTGAGGRLDLVQLCRVQGFLV
jgi:DNA-binding NarL/FixJ family response regulator